MSNLPKTKITKRNYKFQIQFRNPNLKLQIMKKGYTLVASIDRKNPSYLQDQKFHTKIVYTHTYMYTCTVCELKHVPFEIDASNGHGERS